MVTHEFEQTILVTDNNDTPLLTLPFATILRQKQFYRLVAVALLSIEGQLFLRKRTAFPREQKNYTYWGLPVLPLKHSTSRQDIAEEIVKNAVGSFEVAVHFYKEFQLLGWHNFHGTLFKATLPKGATLLEGSDLWLCVDQDEVQGLATEVPEMLAPEVLWALKQDILFSHKK